MTKEELIDALANLEWEDFEVKEAASNLPKSCWDTVSAFANTSGGWLVLGIKQVGKNFQIQGVNNLEKLETDFLNTLRGNKFNAFISTHQERFMIEGKKVLAFYIPASKDKPIYFNAPVNTFIRRGSTDQRATKSEIDAMYRDQTFGTKSSEIAPGTSRSDIHPLSLRRYRDYMSRFNPGVSYNRFDDEEFLRKLRILDQDKCTYGGLLFLGKREAIERHFPDFRIDLLEVPGTSYSDAQSRYTFRLDEHNNLWEYYFECFARLKQKVDVTYRINEEGFGEELSTGLLAIRESLVNMLMHADYFSPACPRIRIFMDHIDFYNPGGLPKPLEELKAKDLSLPRNPIITKLFRMVKIAENAGFGLDKIDSNWLAYNHTDPIYDIAFDSVMVTLKTAVAKTEPTQVDRTTREIIAALGSITEVLEKGSEANLAHLRKNYGVFTGYLRGKYGVNTDYLRDKFNERFVWEVLLVDLFPGITQQQLGDILDTSLSSVEKDMRKLRKEKIIDREGSDKTGKWIIRKK